ncbi:MAG: cytoplasmic protein [Burkholderiaceae bacterium]|nr:type VI secretion system amidase effector protein Tae4 [Aquabacterium sp.]MCK6432701.1 type VI secretion system amidase effector protein Tae4 [Aquabacterium sp.]NUP87838.1 cytoplasmic protein [Burkholderiaceae bacterium]
MAKPSFTAAWVASRRIYDAGNSADRVAQVVGGEVAANIRDKRNPWRNTCAVRLSYILNECGVIVPPSGERTKRGENGRHYFYRVRDVIWFLKLRWGAPTGHAYPPTGGGALAGKKGLIVFEVAGWRDAAGHATLWNGQNCYDHCYFNDAGASYRTSRANFWELD